MPFRSTTIIAALLITLAQPVYAEGIKITPGKWQIQITSTMPMMQQPMVKNLEECITGKEMSPEELMKDSGECQISDIKSSSTHLSWKMQCNSHGGKLTGVSNFDSTGDTMKGSMDMAMNFNGQQMKMHNSWAGKRVGTCN